MDNFWRYLACSIKLLTILMAVTVLFSCAKGREFSSKHWKAHKYRYEMSNELVEKLLMEKPTWEEVQELLGSDGFHSKEDEEMLFFLRNNSIIMGMDSDWLTITFKDGQVDDASVWNMD